MKIPMIFEISRQQVTEAIQDWAHKNINPEIVVDSFDGSTYSYSFKVTASIGTDPLPETEDAP